MAAHWRRARADAGLSQADLASASGVGLDTVQKIERAVVANPGVFTVAKCASAMSVGVDDLLDLTPPPSET